MWIDQGEPAAYGKWNRVPGGEEPLAPRLLPVYRVLPAPQSQGPLGGRPPGRAEPH
jgi:hypothetical protein